MNAAGANARVIDPGVPPSRFARGWHCLGLADSYRDGKPHAIEAFGTKLVVFADSQGELKVLDGYCRHMGGDLTQGTVKGDEIACPFHDWRWGGDGKCKAIPYAKRIPLRARTRSWTVLEQNKQLFVWHDPEGNAPPDEVAIPRIDAAYSDEWTDWTWETLTIDNANCREIIDNVVDMAHFFYIHYAFPTYFKNVFEGHIATQYMNSRGRPDMAGGGYAGEDMLLTSRGVVLRAVVHDQPADDELQRHRGRGHPHQLPLPDQRDVVQAAVRPDRQEARRPRRRDREQDREEVLRHVRRGLPAGRRDLEEQVGRSRTRCSARRTARSTSCGVGTSSSTSTSPTSRRR